MSYVSIWYINYGDVEGWGVMLKDGGGRKLLADIIRVIPICMFRLSSLGEQCWLLDDCTLIYEPSV